MHPNKSYYYIFKAYTAKNQLIKSKPIEVNDSMKIAEVLTDMICLGCKSFFLTSATGQKSISLENFFQSVTTTTIRHLMPTQ